MGAYSCSWPGRALRLFPCAPLCLLYRSSPQSENFEKEQQKGKQEEKKAGTQRTSNDAGARFITPSSFLFSAGRRDAVASNPLLSSRDGDGSCHDDVYSSVDRDNVGLDVFAG